MGSNGDLNLEGHMKVWPGYQPTMKGVCHLWAANLAPSVKSAWMSAAVGGGWQYKHLETCLHRFMIHMFSLHSGNALRVSSSQSTQSSQRQGPRVQACSPVCKNPAWYLQQWQCWKCWNPWRIRTNAFRVFCSLNSTLQMCPGPWCNVDIERVIILNCAQILAVFFCTQPTHSKIF